MKEKMSFVLTSCGRTDLLDRTLQSFFKYNDYPLEDLYLTEDSIDNNVYKQIEKKWKNNLKLLFNKNNIDFYSIKENINNKDIIK